MLIRELPDDERPRERLLAHGAGCLSDAELLALCLGTGTRGRNAIELARELLQGTGGVAPLLGSDAAALLARPGLGAAKVCQLKAALELSRRALAEEIGPRVSLGNPRRSAEYLQSALLGRPYEVFACLFLDQRHREIGRAHV